jgi:hypothetical protein
MSQDLPRNQEMLGKVQACRSSGMERPLMLRNVSGVITLTAFLFTATTAFAAPTQARRHVVHHWHGYGFLPGYRSPERIELEQARARGPVYWYGGPGFYRGRWNGGGFGPCWTQTPIGNVWNCGR